MAKTGTTVLSEILRRDQQSILSEWSRHQLGSISTRRELMSGLEVCSRIKTDPSLDAIQVLQLSATAISDADKVRGLEGGADAYLAEPAGPDVVVATIHGCTATTR